MDRSTLDRGGSLRRDFLKFGAAGGLLGLSLPDLLRARASAGPAAGRGGLANGVIQIWLAGGPATIDMWDPKPDADERYRGEFRAIATSAPGISIAEHLPGVAKVMDRCALVRSLGHTITAHEPGTAYMVTGNRPGSAVEHPALGSLAAKLLPGRPGVPPYVTFAALGAGAPGVGPGFAGPGAGPFAIEGDPGSGSLQARGVSLPEGFSPGELDDRRRLLARFDRGLRAQDASGVLAGLDGFGRQAAEILRSDRIRSALDLGREPESTRDDYGRTPIGQGALAARRLIEAGARFVTLGSGGWDTHIDGFRTLRDQLLPPLDRALSALIRDLEGRGLLGETLVVVAGEFGRTPRVNPSAGRDHWSRTMAALLAGGGIKGGVTYGSTDARGLAPAADPCSPDDLASTIFRRLGFEPRHEVETAGGRPIAIFRDGRVLEPLIA